MIGTTPPDRIPGCEVFVVGTGHDLKARCYHHHWKRALGYWPTAAEIYNLAQAHKAEMAGKDHVDDNQLTLF